MIKRNGIEESQDTKTAENEILNLEELDAVHGGSEPSQQGSELTLEFLGRFAGALKDIPQQFRSTACEKASQDMRNTQRNID